MTAHQIDLDRVHSVIRLSITAEIVTLELGVVEGQWRVVRWFSAKTAK